MSTIPLSVGVMRYDRCDALFDGTVAIEGAGARFEGAAVVTEIFKRMIAGHEFDVAELGWTYYLRTLDLDDPPFVAIPVFPNRAFRHSAIYVNVDSGIRTPQDLAGKTIGEFAVYGHDAGFWPKGILADEYGFRPEQSRWVVGGLDFPMERVDFVPAVHPSDVDVTTLPAGRDDLGVMLERGEIDALISADAPRAFLDGSPDIRPLFDDPRAAERDHYRRTGTLPIMHTLVLRRDVAERHPGLAHAVYQAFCAAKELAAQRYRRGRVFTNAQHMIPWLSSLYDENVALLGTDWWPYGIAANRTTLDTLLRYHHEQGLSRRRLTCEDVFVPELMDT